MHITKLAILFIYIALAAPCAFSGVFVQSYTTGTEGTQYSETRYDTESDKEKDDKIKTLEEELKIKEEELKKQEQLNLYQYPNRVIYQQVYSPYMYPYNSFRYNSGGLSINYNSHNDNMNFNKYRPPQPHHHPPARPKDGNQKDYGIFNKKVD